MSFSAVMDEVNPEFEVPTRPVTPVQDDSAASNTDHNGHKLYYSESVNRELNKLSKDLSGVTANTIFSSKAMERMPPAFGGDSGIYSHMNHEYKRPNEDAASETLHGYQVSQARYTLAATNPPLQHQANVSNAIHQPSTSTAHAPQPAQLNHLLAAFCAPQYQQRQMAVDPTLLSPVTASSSSASPPPGLLEHLSPPPDYTSHLPDLYAPLSAPSSQPHTSGDSAGSPPSVLSNFFSPNPSAAETMLEAAISESEDENEQGEYHETPRRPSAASRTNRSPSSNSKTKAKGKAKVKSQGAPPHLNAPTRLNPAAISPALDPPDLEMSSAAPDAEANSEYQDSESGDECYHEKQDRALYSGGPSRPKVNEKHRAAPKPAHPYKNFKNLVSQGTGRQVCKYVSPYDGWKCEQILARSYDVPRHMEVHAKEEYELVLTGKLPVHSSELFECVTEANVYVCLVCRKDFSRKDAMQRHVRSSSKMSKAKHRAEAKASLKKRVLGTPLVPHLNAVPTEILQRHRCILEKLKVEAQELGQDVTDWDVENMIPQVGDDTELFGTGPNAPGIPVGRRGGGKPRADDTAADTAPSRPTRHTNRPAVNEAEQGYEEDKNYAPLGTPGSESSQGSFKTPTQASMLAAATVVTPRPQQQQPAKLRLVKKPLKRPSEASSYDEEEGSRADFAQGARYRSSHTRTRSPAKAETRGTTKRQARTSEPSGEESMEMEEKRDTTESEDEEDTYQEETRRRLSDEEVEDMMEVD